MTTTKGNGGDGGAPGDNDLPYVSRRSVVVCRHAAIATSQPLASSIGLDFLRQGANAAETAVAVAAVLAVCEPCMTGCGGDMFSLYFNKNDARNDTAAAAAVTCINGSGKSPAALTLETIKQQHPNDTTSSFRDSALSVTVPGAVQGWVDLLQRHGSGQFTLGQLLEPAAVLAEKGFPVAPLTSHQWANSVTQITKWLKDDEIASVPLARATKPGDIVVNADMARVLRDLGRQGASKGFYQGATGRAIVDVLEKHNGCLTMADLAGHTSSFPNAIAVEYRGHKLWQIPPNGQGIAALIALAGLKHLEQANVIPEFTRDSVGSADWFHAMIEMMRLGFADARAHVTDLDHMKVDAGTWLLDPERIGKRAEALFDPHKATIAGVPDASSCTIGFQVVDTAGNAISFVQSNYQGFGTGIVPTKCGFTLQNRGFGFSLDDAPLVDHQHKHPNAVAPNKRPYHTIIPGMITHADDTNDFYATITNIGRDMQPQGILQLTVAMLAGNLDPQAAIDLPRFCIQDGMQGGVVLLEDGIDESVVNELGRRGHDISANVKGRARSVFGKAHIIKRDRRTGVLWAGADGRADGCAMGF